MSNESQGKLIYDSLQCDEAGCCSANIIDLYSGGALLEILPVYWLSCLKFSWFSSVSMRMLREYLQRNHDPFYPDSYLLTTHNLSISLDAMQPLKLKNIIK
jgi:hypothetical protein